MSGGRLIDMTRWTCVVGMAVAALLAAAPGARAAGTWVQVSCVNPNGTAAPSEGWSVGTSGTPGYGSSESTRCGPGDPMYAFLGNTAAEPVGTTEYLEYQPPAGSKLAGGTLQADVSADGGGYNASGTVEMYEPAMVYPGDVIYQCAWGLSACAANNTHDYTGPVTLPNDGGGDLFIAAGCGGDAGESCNNGEGTDGAYAFARISSADLILSSTASPGGAGFTGTALHGTVRGTEHVLFTASDPDGPGVYTVTVLLDGHPVWSGTPSTNGGKCVPVGTDAGALMFDYQQPCPASEPVEAPVPTRGTSDGPHELEITVTDAAGDPATVLDQEITTSNPQTTPRPTGRGALRARFVLSWSWSGATTRLRHVTVSHLPRAATVTATCTGRHCPRLKPRHVNGPQAKKLLRALDGRRFHAGDVLHLTVSARHHRPERITLTFRNGSEPVARLLKR